MKLRSRPLSEVAVGIGMEVAGYIIGRPHAAGEKTMPYQRFSQLIVNLVIPKGKYPYLESTRSIPVLLGLQLGGLLPLSGSWWSTTRLISTWPLPYRFLAGLTKQRLRSTRAGVFFMWQYLCIASGTVTVARLKSIKAILWLKSRMHRLPHPLLAFST